MSIFKGIADFIIFELFHLNGDVSFVKSMHFFIEDVLKIFSLLTVLIFVISYFRSGLNVEKVKQWLEKKGIIQTHILATLLGAVTPFCSCSSIPLFIGFLESGIPFGATMSFLITSPMINEVAIILLLSLLGPELTLVYVLLGLSIGLLGGLLIHVLRLEHLVQEYVFEIRAIKISSTAENLSMREMITKKWNYSTGQVKEIVKRIWVFILLGVGLGALIHGYVPDQWLLQYAGEKNALAVPISVLVGAPLYSNISGTIPLARVLLDKGVLPGTAIALIMSISALSFPEMVILRKVLKMRMVILFAVILILSFIISGYLINFSLILLR